MRFLSITLSGTGNTAWAAERFREAAEALGHHLRSASAREALALPDAALLEALDDADVLVLAYPVYGADFPPAMKRLIARLVDLHVETRRVETCRAACLCTMGYVDAQGPFAAARALAGAGLELRGYLPILLSNNISLPRLRAGIAPPGLIAKRKKAARRALPAFAAALGEGRRFIRGIGPYLIPGALIRRATSKSLARPSLLWGWDDARCSRCGLCVRECPMGCLSFAFGDLAFGVDCTYCTRCYNRCPEQAILPEGEYAPPDRYRRYLCPPD